MGFPTGGAGFAGFDGVNCGGNVGSVVVKAGGDGKIGAGMFNEEGASDGLLFASTTAAFGPAPAAENPPCQLVQLSASTTIPASTHSVACAT